MDPAGVVTYEYGAGMPDNAGVQLANGSTGAISILNGAVTVINAAYGPWFSQSGGSSLQLKSLTYAGATSQASWCLSATAWATGSDMGTPGAAEDCP